MLNGLSLLAVSEAKNAVRRQVTILAYYAAAGVVGLLGVIFGLMLLHEWMTYHMSSMAAHGIITGALFVIAGIIIGVGLWRKEQRVQNDRLKASAMAAAPLALPLAAKILGSRTGLKTLAVAGVIGAGALIGRNLARS